MSGKALVIACGALAREVVALKTANRWPHLDVACLPAELHNTPKRITDAVRDKIAEHRGGYEMIFVAYADCGTGGELDAMLAQESCERLPGAHCYELYAGAQAFAALAEREPGTFYLTDFLARHFDRLVIRGLGIDRHPELAAQYFANYRRLVYLAQKPSPALVAAARGAAQRLGLAFEMHETGYGALETSLRAAAARAPARQPTWQS